MSTSTASQKTAHARLHILQEIANHEGLTATENELTIQTMTMFQLGSRSRLQFAAHLMDITDVDEIEMTLEEREAARWALGIATDVEKTTLSDRLTALLVERHNENFTADDHEALVRQVNAGLAAIAHGYNAAATIVKLTRQNKALLDVNREAGSSQNVPAHLRRKLNNVADEIDPKRN